MQIIMKKILLGALNKNEGPKTKRTSTSKLPASKQPKQADYTAKDLLVLAQAYVRTSENASFGMMWQSHLMCLRGIRKIMIGNFFRKRSTIKPYLKGSF
jgi:hypothetical protein